MCGKLVLLVVVFADRSNADEEIIHIVSARKGDGHLTRNNEILRKAMIGELKL